MGDFPDVNFSHLFLFTWLILTFHRVEPETTLCSPISVGHTNSLELALFSNTHRIYSLKLVWNEFFQINFFIGN